MNKNQFELAKAELSAKKFEQGIGLTKHLISVSGWVVAIWFILEGLKQIIPGQGADEINALAHVVEATGMGSIGLAVFGVGMTIAWNRERKGKKRAIREKSRYQRMVEFQDPNRESSGLTETGDTPLEED